MVVVTVLSLAAHRVGHRSIEWYATQLFNEWGIGFEEHNYGMLLLVAKGDRKARIEFGAGWGRAHDREARDVMQKLIIPAFKQGEFSTGIVRGVEGMDAMARGESIPTPPRPWWWWPLWIGLAALVVGVVNSLMTHGIDGWGYKFLMFVCVAVATVVMGALFAAGSSRGGGGGGSFGGGGGSFGGGSSGGGGATGSW
ncbi:MAG: TPM domain-containing protein [Planctomycetota bacterium]